MKILQTIKEEVVPLSSKQGLILYVIITCVFQFVLFYAPAIADDAIKQALASEIIIDEELNRLKDDPSELLPIISSSENNEDDDVVVNEVISKSVKMDVAAAKINHSINNEEITAEVGLEPKIIRTSTHTMTAYNSDPRQTDDTPCITANGFNVCEHGIEDTIAANFLKFGTKVMIPELFGDRIFIVRDRMNKRYPDRVDIWMKNYTDAKKFGVKRAEIHVIE